MDQAGGGTAAAHNPAAASSRHSASRPRVFEYPRSLRRTSPRDRRTSEARIPVSRGSCRTRGVRTRSTEHDNNFPTGDCGYCFLSDDDATVVVASTCVTSATYAASRSTGVMPSCAWHASGRVARYGKQVNRGTCSVPGEIDGRQNNRRTLSRARRADRSAFW
jgi:hypothetical protein